MTVSVVALRAVQLVGPFCDTIVALLTGLFRITKVTQKLKSITNTSLRLSENTLQFFLLLPTLGVVSKHLAVSKGSGVDGMKHWLVAYVLIIGDDE